MDSEVEEEEDEEDEDEDESMEEDEVIICYNDHRTQISLIWSLIVLMTTNSVVFIFSL